EETYVDCDGKNCDWQQKARQGPQSAGVGFMLPLKGTLLEPGPDREEQSCRKQQPWHHAQKSLLAGCQQQPRSGQATYKRRRQQDGQQGVVSPQLPSISRRSSDLPGQQRHRIGCVSMDREHANLQQGRKRQQRTAAGNCVDTASNKSSETEPCETEQGRNQHRMQL